jgi:hypothetical protein
MRWARRGGCSLLHEVDPKGGLAGGLGKEPGTAGVRRGCVHVGMGPPASPGGQKVRGLLCVPECARARQSAVRLGGVWVGWAWGGMGGGAAGAPDEMDEMGPSSNEAGARVKLRKNHVFSAYTEAVLYTTSVDAECAGWGAGRPYLEQEARVAVEAVAEGAQAAAVALLALLALLGCGWPKGQGAQLRSSRGGYREESAAQKDGATTGPTMAWNGAHACVRVKEALHERERRGDACTHACMRVSSPARRKPNHDWLTTGSGKAHALLAFTLPIPSMRQPLDAPLG